VHILEKKNVITPFRKLIKTENELKELKVNDG
jgi:hypothetical protein